MPALKGQNQILDAYLSDDDFPQLKAEDYANYTRNNSGKITRGLEKWL